MASITRRSFVGYLVSCAAIAPLWARAAPGYPGKPIRLVVAFSPGTSSDALARLLAQGAGDALSQPIVVENRAGAGGIVGTEHVAMASPDGYTLTLATTSTLITSPLLNHNARYRADKDFESVIGLARSHFVIATANTPRHPKTLQELVARLKQGNGNYATSGIGTVVHLTAERFLMAAGARATQVPYQGSAASLSDVAAGHVMFSAETMAATIPLVQGGKLRALAVTSAERSDALPDVPTVAESGYPGFMSSSWFGVMAPIGTPPAVVEKLNRAIGNVMSTPEMRSRLASLGLEPLDMSPRDFDKFIASEMPVWDEVLQRAAIKLE